MSVCLSFIVHATVLKVEYDRSIAKVDTQVILSWIALRNPQPSNSLTRPTPAAQDLRESLQQTESALSAVAASFGATGGCVQRWRDAEDAFRSAAPPGPPAGEGEGGREAEGQGGAREGDGPLGVSRGESSRVESSRVASPLPVLYFLTGSRLILFAGSSRGLEALRAMAG